MTTYNKAGAAAYLTVCVRTLEQLMHDGKIAFSRIGRRVVFRQSELDALLLRHQTSASADRKDAKKELSSCQSSNVMAFTTPASARRAAAELSSRLEQKTKPKRKSYTTSSSTTVGA